MRIPRANLLNQFADVTEAGDYESSIENANKRFFTMLGTLVQGRVCVGGAGINAAKVALTIATRYRRTPPPVRGRGPRPEQLILDYGMHQRRLFPLIARTYALHFAQEYVAGALHDVFMGVTGDEQSRRKLESSAAGPKALGTWHADRTIQECREACGGAGYLSENRFTALKARPTRRLSPATYEGDNHVLLQLVGMGLPTDYSSESRTWTSSRWSG